MLQKFDYIPFTDAFTNDFNSISAEVCGVNIKEIKRKETTVQKKKTASIPKTEIVWGIFVHLRLENGDQYDAVWRLDKTVTILPNTVPMTKVHKTKKIDKEYISSPVPTVLRAVGANEWVDMIGCKVRIKSWSGIFPAEHGFGISPAEEKDGRWFYPAYFEIHAGGYTNE